MARRRSQEAGRRLLSLWDPPPGAGAPVGVLATTFTLDTGLFEEECLARFAGVQSDPARDGALYRIEREERLSELMCATVVADIHHCAGARSLRWDLLPARPPGGVMHAKVSLLAWRAHVRAIVASANLAEEGYRRNQECAAVLDFDPASAERGLLDPLLAYLRDILDTTNGEAALRARTFLDWVSGHVSGGAARPKGIQRHLVLVGPGRPSVFSQLADLLPSQRAESARVVSPFFDAESRADGPGQMLWQLLRQRGDACVQFHVAGTFSPEIGRWRLQAPDHLAQAHPAQRDRARVTLHPVATQDVPTEYGPERRPLHAKSLLLQHPDWTAWMVGSSNFTSAGTGLAQKPNFEANVLYVARRGAPGEPCDAIEETALRGGEPVAPATEVVFEPAHDDDAADPGAAPLPRFFAEATLAPGTGDAHRLALRFGSGDPPAAWRIHHADEVVADASGWLAAGRPRVLDASLRRDGPPPAQLLVEWNDGARSAYWPVNIQSASVLPPPDELRGLSLSALLELLSSARPLHESLRGWLRRQHDDDDADGFEAVELVDPHRKVDTSGFLVKRVQRACAALAQVRGRLEAPVPSESSLAWRIDGPLGLRAVAAAIEAQCDPTLPDERAFLLCELARELDGVRLRDADGKPVPPELRHRFEAVRIEFRRMRDDALRAASPAMRAYADGEGPSDGDATA